MELMDVIQLAVDATAYSYVPYSGFRVGAALVSKEGKVFTGCNIENASFTPSNCAERTAFFKAVSEGFHEFEKIVIVGGKNGKLVDYCPPCGVCRQVMMEFCNPDTFEVILAKNRNEYKIYLLKDLLPFGFGPSNLEEE